MKQPDWYESIRRHQELADIFKRHTVYTVHRMYNVPSVFEAVLPNSSFDPTLHDELTKAGFHVLVIHIEPDNGLYVLVSLVPLTVRNRDGWPVGGENDAHHL